MAKNKKTFIFYSDWINMIREMPNEDAGELLKHILSYVNDEEPETKNLLVKMAFGHMKPMLKSDLNKWETQLEKYSEMGKKSAQARKNKPKLTKVEPTLKQVKRTSTVNDNVNVNEIIDKSITITKAEEKLDFNKNTLFKNIITKDSVTVENFSRMNKTNTKTIIHYLELFNSHLITTHEIKKNQKEYQQHYGNWLRMQKIETINEAYPNPYREFDKDL